MLHRLTKKTVVLITVGVLFIAGAGVAFAYWTAGGSGTGTAATGSSEGLTVNQTSVVVDMGPDVDAQPLSGDFDNPNDGPTYVGFVTVTFVNATDVNGVVIPGCDADDYTITGAEMDVSAEVPAGDAQGAWSGATIAFNNDPAANQDDCKGATVNLAYEVAEQPAV